jgi:hypothetical protein
VQAKVIDIQEELAKRSAIFFMSDNLVITEAELTARLLRFPEDHVGRILKEAKIIKGVK